MWLDDVALSLSLSLSLSHTHTLVNKCIVFYASVLPRILISASSRLPNPWVMIHFLSLSPLAFLSLHFGVLSILVVGPQDFSHSD